MNTPSKPLAGVKVLELGTLIAGPFCTRILAEFGAEVIKVESPDGGDPLRQWRKLHEGTSLWWSVQARNKKSITANLKHPEGLAVVRRLAERPTSSSRTSAPACSKSSASAGMRCRRPTRAGDGAPVGLRPDRAVQGAAGLRGDRRVDGRAALHHRLPDRPPVRTGISIGDSIAALWAAIGALMALRHREVNGGAGQVVDVALYEAVFAMMESMVPEFDVAGFVRERTGNVMPGITPSNTHTTRDGRHIIIGGNGDAIFVRLMRAIGRPDLADDPQLASNAGRDARAAELYAAIDAWVAAHDGDAVLAAMEAAEVPASAIYSVADMFRDAQFAARGMFESATLPDGTPIHLPGIVPKLAETPGGTEWLGPKLGEHTSEILAGLGFSAEEILALREKGAI
jgi:formyl-CoA transferase